MPRKTRRKLSKKRSKRRIKFRANSGGESKSRLSDSERAERRIRYFFWTDKESIFKKLGNICREKNLTCNQKVLYYSPLWKKYIPDKKFTHFSFFPAMRHIIDRNKFVSGMLQVNIPDRKLRDELQEILYKNELELFPRRRKKTPANRRLPSKDGKLGYHTSRLIGDKALGLAPSVMIDEGGNVINFPRNWASRLNPKEDLSKKINKFIVVEKPIPGHERTRRQAAELHILGKLYARKTGEAWPSTLTTKIMTLASFGRRKRRPRRRRKSRKRRSRKRKFTSSSRKARRTYKQK